MHRHTLLSLSMLASLLALGACSSKNPNRPSSLKDQPATPAAKPYVKYYRDENAVVHYYALFADSAADRESRIELKNCQNVNAARAILNLPAWNAEEPPELLLSDEEFAAYHEVPDAAVDCLDQSSITSWKITALYSGLPDYYAKVTPESGEEFWFKVPGQCSKLIQLSGIANYINKNRVPTALPTTEQLDGKLLVTAQCEVPGKNLAAAIQNPGAWQGTFYRYYELPAEFQDRSGVLKITRGGQGFGVYAIDGKSVSAMISTVFMPDEIIPEDPQAAFAPFAPDYKSISEQFQIAPSLENYATWSYNDWDNLLEDSKYSRNAPILSLCLSACSPDLIGKHYYLDTDEDYNTTYIPVVTLNAEAQVSKRPETFGKRLIKWVYGKDGETLVLDGDNDRLIAAMGLKIVEAALPDFSKETDVVLLGEPMPDNLLPADLQQASKECTIQAFNMTQVKRDISLYCKSPVNKLTVTIAGNLVLNQPWSFDKLTYPSIKTVQLVGTNANAGLVYTPTCGESCLDRVAKVSSAIKVKDGIKLVVKSLKLRMDKAEATFPADFRVRAIDAIAAPIILDRANVWIEGQDRGFDTAVYTRQKSMIMARGTTILVKGGSAIDTDSVAYIQPAYGDVKAAASSLESKDGSALSLIGASSQVYTDGVRITSATNGVSLARGAKAYFYNTRILAGANAVQGLSNGFLLEGSEAVLDTSDVNGFRSAFLVKYDSTSSTAKPSKVASRNSNYCVYGQLVFGASNRLDLQPAGITPAVECRP